MSGLKKSLGTFDIIALAFGAMVGWGWVVLAGGWIIAAGTWGAMLAFLLGGLAVILIGVTYAELASSMPITGGEHTYTHRALGVNVSFICSWSILFGYFSVVAFEAVALPTVVEYFIPNYNQGFLWTIAGWDVYATWVGVGMLGSVIVTWLNIRGMEVSAWFQKTAVVGILFVGILLFIGAALYNPATSTAVQAPAFIGGAAGIMAVIVMVPFMFVGFDVIPQAAEEIDLTRPNIGKFLIVSIVIAVLWYIAVAWSVGTTLPLIQAQGSTLATADAMTNAWNGKWAGILLVIGGVLGILSSWNAFLIGGSRLLYAMSKAHMLPAFLGKLHPKYNTPVNAILLIGGLATLAPLFGRKMLVWIVDAGGFGIVIAYTCVAISFLVLRYREPDMVRPFRIPAGKFVGVVTIILSIGLLTLYMPGMPSALIGIEWWIFLGWTVLGISLYSYARIKYPGISEAIMAEELRELKIVNQLWLKDNPPKK
ncbi:APC family permease [Psychrobacter sp. LV10R520-6]|uniref:APC family permease n=1 Tax=Psychrobacter sp. LV10R520-6 TaxID=1415574 RepID=UPI0024C5966F|nr:APC family permease [Psychrobacter sp. LV10R520-6]SNT70185.1 amino acid/polyamine/organocation transporter, APC superfamily [Psychrobacter sp. LV10R520-6]